MADADIRISARNETGAAFTAIQRSFGQIEQSAIGLRGAIGGIAAGLGVAALANLGRDAINAADEINKLSQKTAIGAESLSKLQYAAKLSDVSTESLATGLKGLNKAIDGNDDSFKQLGVSLRNSNGSLRGTDEVLGDIAEAFSRSDDTAGKSALAIKLFGKAGTDLIPLLNQGRDGLKSLGDEAARLGLVISADTARAAEAFNDNLTRLATNSRALGLALAEATLPSLNRFTSELLKGREIFGSYFEALLGLGTINPFKTQAENIRDLNAKADELQRKLAAVNANSGGRIGFRGDVPLGVGGPNNSEAEGLRKQLDIVQKQLKFEQFRQRQDIPVGGADTFDARDLALRGKKNIASQPDAPAAAKDDGLKQQLAKLDLANAIAAQQDQNAVAEIKNKIELEAQTKRELEAQKLVNEEAQRLNNILDQTPSGKLKALEDEGIAVNNALIKGKISAEQFNEAFEVLAKRRDEILGVGKNGFQKVADDGAEALKRIEQAVKGFGDKFTTTFTALVVKGKLDFTSLADSILSDIVRITVQTSITDPLVKAGTSGLTKFLEGLGSGASAGASYSSPFLGTVGRKALGGPVAAGVPYLVGEVGPELFMPNQSGTIVPNNAMGGVTLHQTVHIGAGVDRAQVALAMRQATEAAKADIARARRLGPSVY